MSDKEAERRRKIDEQKEFFDAVTKAWLDEKYALFGRWTVKALLAIAFVVFLRFIWYMNAHDLRAVLDTAQQAQELAR